MPAVEEKKETLTWERAVEGLYGFRQERKKYTPEELARYRTRLREYAREKAAQRAEKHPSLGPRTRS